MGEALISYERGDDGVALITLRDPPANTYSCAMMRELEAPDAQAFLDRVRERAREFAPPGRASRAVGLIKRAVRSGAEIGFAEGLALERELHQQLFESEDAREGLSAHAEKRPPRFRGR